MKAPRASTAVAIAAGVAFALAACTGAPVIATPKVEPNLTAFTIVVGDCINDGNSNTEVVPEIVDCALPHDNEAYLSVILEDGAFPGAAAIEATAIQECTAGFKSFAGIAHDRSLGLDFSWYYPSGQTWAMNDREILCLIHEVGEDGLPVQSTGSLEGASR